MPKEAMQGGKDYNASASQIDVTPDEESKRDAKPKKPGFDTRIA
jgi:hypothetical protein